MITRKGSIILELSHIVTKHPEEFRRYWVDANGNNADADIVQIHSCFSMGYLHAIETMSYDVALKKHLISIVKQG